jgi:aryl-alcohol dehydrogenase-like predicted oxidoreductase
MSDGPNWQGLSRPRMLRFIDESLARLRTTWAQVP